MTYTIQTIPMLQDNYAYTISCDITGEAVAIDCGDSTPILDFLHKDIKLKKILLTHHHGDHIDGVNDILKVYEKISIIGNAKDAHRMKCVNVFVNPTDTFEIFKNLEVQVIALGGHTIGCVGYYIPALSALFTGDALFTMGCGRMFEGTYDMFFASMKKIKSLPEDTRLYGGHEYTASNIDFCKSLMKSNSLIENIEGFDDYVSDLQELINNGVPTVPSFLGNECKFNPCLLYTSDAADE